MKLELLLSVVNFNSIEDVKNHINKANIKSDVVVVNQSCFGGYEESLYNSNNIIRFISMVDKGVGISRNTALLKTKADIAMFVDDDEFFVDGYEEKILKAFKLLPDADVIIFNVESKNINRKNTIIRKTHRVRWFNFMRYGAYQIVIKVESIKKYRIYFSTFFGGGCVFGSGEDSLFLSDVLDSGLKIYAFPEKIAYVRQDSSSWFKGYNGKYFFDRGVLYSQIFKFPNLLGFIQLIRKNTGKELSCFEKFRFFYNGTRFFG